MNAKKPTEGAQAIAKATTENKPAKMTTEEWLRQPVGHADQMAQIAAHASRGLAEISGAAFDAGRVARIGMLMRLSAQKVPQLLKCTRHSLMWSVLDLARMRLEPDGEHAALVPYGAEAKAVPMYKGWIDIVADESQAHVQAYAVYRGETFRVQLGTDTRVIHEMALDVDRSDDNVIAAYSVFHIPGRRALFDVMSRQEIDKRKAVSKSATREDSPWNLWYAEKAKVTVIKRGAKYLPRIGDRFAAAAEIDARADNLDRHLSAELAGPSVTAEVTPSRGNDALAAKVVQPKKQETTSAGPPSPPGDASPPEPSNTQAGAALAADAAGKIAGMADPAGDSIDVGGVEAEIADDQKSEIMNLCDKLGATNVQARTPMISSIVGREVPVLGALSFAEAANVITALREEVKKKAAAT